MASVFFIVATGQNVSNLPPLFEYAKAGDKVCWILTDLASRRGFQKGAEEPLSGFKVGVLPEIRIPDSSHPGVIRQKVEAYLDVQKISEKFDQVFFVANGGHKLAPIGILNAFFNKDIAFRMLYGNDRPVGFWEYDKNLQPTTKDLSWYKTHKLNLSDVLATAGFVFSRDSKHRKIWPAVPSSPLSTYDSNAPTLHESAYFSNLIRSHVVGNLQLSFEEIDSLSIKNPDISKLYEKWQVQYSDIHAHIQNIAKKDSQAVNKDLLSRIKPKIWQDLSNYETTLRKKIRKECLKLYPEFLNNDPIGPKFEVAVAERVVRFLDTHSKYAAIVQEVWANVTVVRKSAPAISVMEMDVAMLLKNGVVLSLEAKTALEEGELSSKDLKSRLLNLQNSTSQLARLAIVYPLLTEYLPERWALNQHKIAGTVKKANLPAIVYNLPNQPVTYTLNGKDYTAPSFEQSLESFLKNYLP